jgi:hypothetical protein
LEGIPTSACEQPSQRLGGSGEARDRST